MADEERIQFKFMIPKLLKTALEDAAHENRRSLSAEIVARLEESITPARPPLPPGEAVRELEETFERIMSRLRPPQAGGKTGS